MTPKYTVIERYLLEELKSGKYSVGDKLPTEKELMNKFSASRETVRKALDRLSFKAAIVRRPGLGTFVSYGSDNHLVGILVQQITSYIFPYIVLGAEDHLFRNEYKMLLGNSAEDPVKERQILTEWIESGVKGLIIDPVYSATKRSNKDLVKSMAKSGVKIVLVHSDWNIDNVSCNVLDDAYGGEKASEIFFEYGHQRVAVIYKSTHLPGVIRAKSFVDRCKQLGFTKIYEKSFNVSEFTGAPMQIAHELMSLPSQLRPTAVFCYNDATALQLQLVAKRLALNIPEDISVIGFDDGPIGDFREVLTTFAHPKEEVGRKSVEILLDMLNGSNTHRVVHQPELIERSSVAEAKQYLK
ncbi:GntR family transcriptional regulator [Mesotoga sp.]|uniref:GntR family transcriptional regulator n=1 Tax=unclassified Mesotoga TaxID=1184398 RepID=UPI0016000345|nr:GntR family transcriptional regulator [Thermotogota bacterium]NLT45871.1 substrate-binding domain-containing protein [Thermotogaceae bacterium]